MKTTVISPSLWITLILLSGVSGYGFWSERLFERKIWSSLGLDRLAQVGTVYMLAAVAVYFWKPFFATPLFLLLAALYSFAVVGPLAPLCVLFFLCSSFLLGRLLFPGEGTVKLSRIRGFWRRNQSALERRINNLGSVQDAE